MMNLNEIKAILPHRAPFLQIDKVLEIVEGEYIVAIRGVSNSEEIFAGHFPNNPILPGVIIIESMAQAAGLLAFRTMGRVAHQNQAYVVAAVDKTRFRRTVVPGDQLELRAVLRSRKKTIWKFDATATVEGNEVASAVITCAEKDL